MICIIDYGVGNLFSLESSFKYLGADVIVTNDKNVIEKCDKIILPGVGAFCDAMKKLTDSGLDIIIKEQVKKGKMLLGICLGMQLLFDKSYEYGEYNGLSLIKGNVKPLAFDIGSELKIPHIGWNSLNFPKDKEKNLLFKYVSSGECVYFMHSYYATDCSDIIAYCDYGIDVCAAVNFKNVYGAQFHPEKSGETGLKILKAFIEL